MYNRIEIQIPEKFQCLAGEEYARLIYRDQIANKIDITKRNVIVIPSHIRIISSSFAVGLINSCNIKPDKFDKHFSIEGNDRVVYKFKDILG